MGSLLICFGVLVLSLQDLTHAFSLQTLTHACLPSQGTLHIQCVCVLCVCVCVFSRKYERRIFVHLLRIDFIKACMEGRTGARTCCNVQNHAKEWQVVCAPIWYACVQNTAVYNARMEYVI